MRNTKEHPQHYNDLHQTISSAEAMLAVACEKGSALRTPAVSTHNPKGFPSSRIMIVRDFEPGSRSMTFFTDARTPKITEIRSDPRVSILFYDPSARVQMRIEATAQMIAGGEPTRIAWDGLPVSARRDYMADQTPAFVSSAPTSGLPSELDHTNVDIEQTEDAYANFAIIAAKCVSLDWLYLDDSGNRRARHEWSKPELAFATPSRSVWLVP